MGYSCPVCADPQADGVHLANHLAITALTRGGDHEEYLDESVPEWQELSEEELAAELLEDATEADYPQVFEDTTTSHEHNHDHDHGGTDAIPYETDMPDTDGETEDVIEEALELTQQRRQNAAGEDGDDDGKTDEPETE